MSDSGTLFGRIQASLSNLSEAKKNVGQYILENWQDVSFLTASRVAQRVGVSESVVVRFAQDVGYSGFPDLQNALQAILQNRLTAVKTLGEVNTDVLISKENGCSGIAQKIFDLTVKNLQATQLSNSSDSFEKAIELIMSSNRIAVVGSRNARGPATVLAVHLNEIFTNTILIGSGTDELFDSIRSLYSTDLLITIGLPTYGKHTILASELAYERGVNQITITDSLISPLAKQAAVALLVQGMSYSFANSHIASLFVVDILLHLITVRGKGRVLMSLEEIDLVNRRYGLVLSENEK
ncbi:MurR/RpiR family transcriptional regulator [Paenibacillus radicis (ex Xue et al. 2023)]|uniref:MurR/RpiR family transcriptional regulator n=1 Tax=Paenibacillus radicis (ex Xue et al. 2023) TaxID=2972489 RepID=A0ABT1YIK0_9BACL|nr:MurR/RpiR family transcriptional regulator [Paenibacillus radicis (ex Xue et al. 2023)]MCR8632787.1 MurR/RpiR family transcriptional regulator [Paenibacillus radicis (ex Xue et al. 2023)]